ncbi:MAG: chemotaxis protein CheD [Oscillospiraceae bacterium]|jgi:chemotaxis protein CheD|nr:chemotaxis protein CheD [Oscillospiraceae bacterium]
MSNTIKVGIADLNVCKAPDVLVTYALGSCVGICLYDVATRVAGLSHIMLPICESGSTSALSQPYRFADTAIPLLVKKMEQLGCNKLRLKAKIAGGAKMFAAAGNSSIGNIGIRNVIAVKAALSQLRIQVVAEDTGKDFGRTVFFSAADGVMVVKSATKGEWNL